MHNIEAKTTLSAKNEQLSLFDRKEKLYERKGKRFSVS